MEHTDDLMYSHVHVLALSLSSRCTANKNCVQPCRKRWDLCNSCCGSSPAFPLSFSVDALSPPRLTFCWPSRLLSILQSVYLFVWGQFLLHSDGTKDEHGCGRLDRRQPAGEGCECGADDAAIESAVFHHVSSQHI